MLETKQSFSKLLNVALLKLYIPNDDWLPLIHLFNHPMNHTPQPRNLTFFQVSQVRSIALAPSNASGNAGRKFSTGTGSIRSMKASLRMRIHPANTTTSGDAAKTMRAISVS